MPSALFFAAVLAVLPALFWFWFYFGYLAKSSRELKKTALLLFVVGAATSGIAYGIERFGFTLIPQLSFVAPGSIRELWWLFAASFLFVAPVEEGVKFLGIRFFAFPSLRIDRVADMIRAGVAVGLGFATVENALYFLTALAQGTEELSVVFLLRFGLSTFAHTLYSAVMAYFLGLAKFHMIYRGHFMRQALIIPVLLHGAFNFFILLGINFVSVTVLGAALAALLLWFSQRVNFQAFLPAAEARKVLLPLLSNRKEFEAFLSHERVGYAVIRKLGFCPFCLAKKDFVDQARCANCNARLRPPQGEKGELLAKPHEVSPTDVGE